MVCMCVRSDVLSGVGGSESSSCWYSLATVVRGGRALCLRAGALRRWCSGCVGQSVDV